MVAGLQLPLSSRCVKYLMFTFNLLFVITGIILLSIGAVGVGIFNEYNNFLSPPFYSVPTLLIAIGLIIFFIAFFGCCGALRENYCLIVTFAALMVFVFILELAGGISGYVLRSQAKGVISDNMHRSMINYPSNTSATALWDAIQEKFNCCGTNEKEDWEIVWPNGTLPLSCCGKVTGSFGSFSCNVNSTSVHTDGCLDNFLTFVKSHAVQLGGVGISIAFIQLIGIWFAIHLAKSIKNSYETV